MAGQPPEQPTGLSRPAALLDGRVAEGSPPLDVVLQRATARDPEAWQVLLDVFGPVIHSCCRRSGLQFEDAADIAQNVFCSLMLNLGKFAPGQSTDRLRAWVWTITQNKLRDHFRRRARDPRAGGGEAYRQLLDLPQPEPPGLPVARGEGEVFHRALLVLRGEFEERTWTAFWRSVVDEQESTRVGEELGMSANAVRKAKSRVLRRLREELSR
jgi:RNA polymerase sigma-70 factor (ECF subfamily)